MIKSHPEEFAEAVVNSSSPDLSVDEKFELYMKALNKAVQYNKDVNAGRIKDFYGNSKD